jgi:peroxiredoxin
MSKAFWWRRWAGAAVVAAAIAAWSGYAVGDESGVPGGANLNFTLKDMNGTDVRLASLRGRPIILNFWATWCGPCRAEIPVFIDLADQYKAQNLTILGVSVDDSPDELKRFAAEHHMNYPVLVGQGHDKLQETYDAVMYVPITWLIRADGTVFLKHSGPATREWFEAQVKALVAPAVTPEATDPGRPVIQ